MYFGSEYIEMIPVLDSTNQNDVNHGAITKSNYTDSKSGKVGDFHHTLGSIVEIKDDETFFVRQVTADDKSGDFSDLYNRVSDGNVKVRLYSCCYLR
jgi:hypothetical protein